MFEFGIRIGKVVQVNYGANTVDVLLDSGFGVIRDVPIVFNLLSTNAGCYELPILKTVAGIKPGNVVLGSDGSANPITDLYHLENTVGGKVNLDDPTTNYAYAVIIGANEQYSKSNPVCLGFLLPHRNQILFDPDNVNPDLPEPVKTAVTKLKGAYLHRTNSGVYEIVDLDGNYEWSHPNGSFIRIAEFPTQDEDGAIHVDYNADGVGANKRAKNGDDATNIVWDNTQQKGADGNPNNQRDLYAHVEIKTAKGIVSIDIDKTTGNVTILTPVDASGADSDNNQLKIICGGNATLESVQGDVLVQSVNGQISVQSKNTITLETDTAGNGSIVLGPNGDNGTDHLVLLSKLEQKFNNHQHVCTGSGHQTTGPTKTFDDSDGTTVTIAG